jgi:hypothetical protein
MLQGLILAGLAQPAVHRLHRLPLTVVEQAVEILAGGVSLWAPTETRAEAVEELAQAAQQCPRGPCGHMRSVPNTLRQYQRNRSVQTRRT